MMSKSYICKGKCDVFMGDIQLGTSEFEYTVRADNAEQAQACITDMVRDEGGRNIEFTEDTKESDDE